MVSALASICREGGFGIDAEWCESCMHGAFLGERVRRPPEG